MNFFKNLFGKKMSGSTTKTNAVSASPSLPPSSKGMMRFDRFDESAQKTAQRSAEIMQNYGYNQIDTEHFLLALLEEPGGAIPQMLKKLNANVDALTGRIEANLRASAKANIYGGVAGQIFITPRVKRVIDLANEEANRLKDEYISTEHIFLAILTERNTPAVRILEGEWLTHGRVFDAIHDLRGVQSETEPQGDTHFRDALSFPSSLEREMQFDRYTGKAQETVQRAVKIMQNYGHNQIDTEHFLLALVEQPDGLIPQILEKMNINVDTVNERLDVNFRASPKAKIFGGAIGQIFITPRVKRIINLASEETNRLNDDRISTEHMFLAILTERNTPAARILESVGVRRDRVYEIVQDLRGGQSATDSQTGTNIRKPEKHYTTEAKGQPVNKLNFPSKPIDWETKLTNDFYVERSFSFADEQDIITDLEAANLESLSANLKWNLSLCLAYGSDKLAAATAAAIFKVIQKRDDIEPLRWMANTMLNSGELPSGIDWEGGVKGLKTLLENCPTKYYDELYNLILDSTGYDIAYSYNPSQDESNDVVFVQETKNQSQLAQAISTYRVYRGASKKAAYDFLTKKVVNQKMFHLVVETPDGNFCRDINGIYKERQ